MASYSQKDMFDSTDTESNVQKRISSTYDPSKTSHEYKYEAVIIFDWDVEVELPFSVCSLSSFNSKEIKPIWIKKNLGVMSRITKIKKLSPFPNGTHSLFGKFELGKKKILYILYYGLTTSITYYF